MSNDMSNGTVDGGGCDACFDLTATLERLDGDLELLHEVGSIFLQIAPEMMQALRDSLVCQDVPAVATAAHRLAGSLGNFDHGECFHTVVRLEHLARNSQLKGAEEIYADLEIRIERMMSSLRASLSSIASS